MDSMASEVVAPCVPCHSERPDACEAPLRKETASTCAELAEPAELGELEESTTDEDELTEFCPRREAKVEKPLSHLGVLIFLCVACGCSCQAPYEILNSKDKGCSHLISLVEHIFGLTVAWRGFRRRLPLHWHLCLAAGSVGYTQLQNLALSTRLPILVLITIKNGNLLANVFLGKLILQRHYGVQRLSAVLLLSCGLVLGSVGEDAETSETGSCLAGILLLAGALLSRSAGGLLQEYLSQRLTVPVEELLFYRCLLGLPAVLLHSRSIRSHGGHWIAGASFGWPGPWVLLSLNTVMDHVTRVCITLVIQRASALTANLVLTFQRFASFVISAVLLSAPPSASLCLGAVLVLAGTFLYALAPEASPKEKSA